MLDWIVSHMIDRITYVMLTDFPGLTWKGFAVYVKKKQVYGAYRLCRVDPEEFVPEVDGATDGSSHEVNTSWVKELGHVPELAREV
jgi:hypothetical protein